MGLLETLNSLPVCRLTTVPRHDDTSGDPERERRVAALVSAFHAGGPVGLSWRRDRPGSPVEVFVAGDGLFGGDADPVALTLPSGGRGTRLPTGAMADVTTSAPHWVPIQATVDGLLLDDHDTPAVRPRPPTLEDCLLAAWTGPFAWLVLAEPIPAAELASLRAEAAEAERDAWRKREQSPKAAVEADRLRYRHRELAAADTTGAWRVRLAAGAQSPSDAHRVAGLLCASTDLRGHPYSLRPNTSSTPDQVVFTAGTALLAHLTRAPALETPGVHFELRPDFDVSPEIDGEVGLGVILDRNRAASQRMSLSRANLNRHTFVCGATGAGKSQTTRNLLQSAAERGIPWFVVEPAKAEYRAMASRLAGTSEVIVIRPGEVDAFPAGINPLEPSVDAHGRRFPLQTHADMVRALFLAAFDADEPFPQVLSMALTRCYTELGWDLALGEPRAPGITPRYPTLRDLERVAERVVDDIGYGKEITDNVRGFIRVRLSSLRHGTTGRFFEGGHQLDFGELLRHNVVFEIEDVGDDVDKAFLMGTVLVRLTEFLRLEQQRGAAPPGLRHLSVFEEAHRLLRNSQGGGAAAHAVEMFAGLLAEIRAYGEGLVVAEQIPSKLIPDVIKNTATKIVHQLPSEDDRRAVGAAMNLTDTQSRFLVTLPPGQAGVFSTGMDFPILTKMDNNTAAEEAPPKPAEATRLVNRRSVTCGGSCAARPCTLREMRGAQRIGEAGKLPGLVLWAELAVTAHLAGWPMPRPTQRLRESLASLDFRTLECAFSHAVDAAVATRTAAFADRVAPEALATHVVGALATQYTNPDDVHPSREPQWLSAPYKWALVARSLRESGAETFTADRHLLPHEWQDQHGDAVVHREHVTAWYNADRRDTTAMRVTVFGDETPSTIEKTVAAARHDPAWETRLHQGLHHFEPVSGGLRKLLKDTK